jgi:hypothetical protein
MEDLPWKLLMCCNLASFNLSPVKTVEKYGFQSSLLLPHLEVSEVDGRPLFCGKIMESRSKLDGEFFRQTSFPLSHTGPVHVWEL